MEHPELVEAARRTLGWNYFPPGGRKRDLAARKRLHPDWPDWPEARQRLRGLVD